MSEKTACQKKREDHCFQPHLVHRKGLRAAETGRERRRSSSLTSKAHGFEGRRETVQRQRRTGSDALPIQADYLSLLAKRKQRNTAKEIITYDRPACQSNFNERLCSSPRPGHCMRHHSEAVCVRMTAVDRLACGK